MVLGGITFKGELKVFNSKGGWAFLFGKPLMQAAHATHDFKTDVIRICSESGTITYPTRSMMRLWNAPLL
jgi:hypothetical protein